jgi:hypothetical protein
MTQLTDPTSTRLRLAISGTFGVGKTTTTEAVSIATGLPRTHALTSREILADLLPGRSVQQLSGRELLLVGLRRLEERIHHEARLDGGFVSDGSVIHEWVYGAARMRMGLNPGAGPGTRLVRGLAALPSRRFYREYLDAYGTVVKHRAKRLYHSFVHLPVEFDLPEDGHRPVSEPFRHLSDRLLIQTLEELEIPYHIVRGSVRQRVQHILDHYELRAVVPVEEAILQVVS